MRPVWLFRRQTQFDAKPHVLKARKRCRYVEGLETKVVLIDGVQVAELMFELPTGVFIY
jgi:restriction endonuclease Mrr